MVREILEGRRLGFALRPVLAAVGLGLGIAVTALDLMGWFAWGVRETGPLVVGATALAVVAAVVGLLGTLTALAETLDTAEEDRTLARLDLLAAGIATALYAITSALRAIDVGAAAASPAAFLLAIAGLIVLAAGAGTASLLYATREWEEVEEVVHERHGRRRPAAR